MKTPSRTALLSLMTAIALSLTCVTVSAQSKKELAAKLIQLQHADYEALGRSLAGQTAQQVQAAAFQALGNLPAEKREATAKEIQGEVRKFFESIEPTLRERAPKLATQHVQPLLEEKFSEDELKQMVAWFESPVSRKYAEFGAQMPDLIAEKLVTDTRSSVEPKLKTLEASLQKKLGVSPSAAPAAPKAPAKK